MKEGCPWRLLALCWTMDVSLKLWNGDSDGEINVPLAEQRKQETRQLFAFFEHISIDASVNYPSTLPIRNRVLPLRFQTSHYPKRDSMTIPSDSERFRFRFRFGSTKCMTTNDSMLRRWRLLALYWTMDVFLKLWNGDRDGLLIRDTRLPCIV
ncbi:hypothetical protein DY000_02040036 [Brassica cretica]|uniref:Uncharacterized protein n=1 Tax=Brassica cretica TaxID=69181 RepID=A0ABQ7BKE6_BRACR|nr:hypothetical protein DY000_02040036 [Brassica cretica]